jgi:nucleoside-triphosphatase
MKIFISGKPGCGKTTLIKEIIKNLKCSFSGFITEEIRKNGRTGFKIIDVKTRNETVLASTDLKVGPKISKYRVNIKGIEEVAVPSLEREAELYIIDEIGAMELCSKKFREKIGEILNSNKSILATLHRNYVNEYRNYGEVIWLTREKWNDILDRIKSKLEVFKFL